MELTDVSLNTTYSAISVKIAFERMETYYLLTLIIPILALTVLSPTGLILPGKKFKAPFKSNFIFCSVDSGEKLGTMITVLLTVVIYIEYIQTSIPVFDTIGATPHLLRLFLTTVVLLTVSLLGKLQKV